MRCVVTCGSISFPWLVFFFGDLLWGSMIHKHTGRRMWHLYIYIPNHLQAMEGQAVTKKQSQERSGSWLKQREAKTAGRNISCTMKTKVLLFLHPKSQTGRTDQTVWWKQTVSPLSSQALTSAMIHLLSTIHAVTSQKAQALGLSPLFFFFLW